MTSLARLFLSTSKVCVKRENCNRNVYMITWGSCTYFWRVLTENHSTALIPDGFRLKTSKQHCSQKLDVFELFWEVSLKPHCESLLNTKRNGCSVSAVVQYTSHSLTRASWVTIHTWTGDVRRSVLQERHRSGKLNFVFVHIFSDKWQVFGNANWGWFNLLDLNCKHTMCWLRVSKEL